MEVNSLGSNRLVEGTSFGSIKNMEGTSVGSIRKVGGGYCGVSDSGRELHEGVSDRRGYFIF